MLRKVFRNLAGSHLPEVESRTQGSRPRPTTQKYFEAKDRPSRGQGQGHKRKCSPKKNVFKFFFPAISKKDLQQFFFRRKWSSKNFFQAMRKPKKGLRKFSARFLALSNKISTVQKIVLSSNRAQGNFGGLEASRPRPRTSKFVLEDVFEAKDVLENSSSAIYTSQENPSATFLQSLHSILLGHLHTEKSCINASASVLAEKT